jgi:hypothetical protein
MSDTYHNIKGALLQSIDDVELESLDTSTSTEGESTATPTQCSPIPMNVSDFENTIYDLIDKQRWTFRFIFMPTILSLIYDNFISLDGTQQYNTLNSTSKLQNRAALI